MNQAVRKAVLPVAGLGTRFLPATKAMPKEMLTVVDRPLLQYVVDEAREAGIEHFIFVTGRNKGMIEDHFDKQWELEDTLRRRGKDAELALLNDLLPPAGTTSFTRQQEPLGLGHAVWCARELVGNEPFALLLPDVLIHSRDQGCLSQMIDVYNQVGGNIIGVEEVPDSETHKYGVVSLEEGEGPTWPITSMVEKPAPGTQLSNLTIVGRYIIQPGIFNILGDRQRGTGGEIQITDALTKLLEQEKFIAHRYNGQSYDCGSPQGFLQATIAYGLDRPEIAGPLKSFIKSLDLA